MSATATVLGTFAAIDGDPLVSGPHGCAIAGTENGMVALIAASAQRGNRAKVAFTSAGARKLAALLIEAADDLDRDASPPAADPGASR